MVVGNQSNARRGGMNAIEPMLDESWNQSYEGVIQERGARRIRRR